MIEYIKEGNFFSSVINGEHDVVLNFMDCFNTQVNQFTTSFQTDEYPLEAIPFSTIDRLGNIDSKIKQVKQPGKNHFKGISVTNCYVIYDLTRDSLYGIRLDYDALRLVFRKVNLENPSHTVGFSMESLEEVGGDPAIIQKIAEEEFYKCKVRIIKPITISV